MNQKPLLFVMLGCGGVGLLVFLGCAGVFIYGALNFKNFDKDVSPVVDRWFAAAASGDLGSTYKSDTSSEFKQTTSQEKYEEIGALVQTRLGALQSKSLTRYNISQQNADRFVDVSYNATFEKGNGTIAARFKMDDDRWVLHQINVHSPEFLLTCPRQRARIAANRSSPSATSAPSVASRSRKAIKPPLRKQRRTRYRSSASQKVFMN